VFEHAARAAGARCVAGVDEVGRGALGGPVVAAAVVLPSDDPTAPARLSGVRDSKALGPARRLALESVIRSVAVGVGVGWVSAVQVDALGIRTATELAMLRALAALPVHPDHVLVDGFPVRLLRLPQHAIVHGDRDVLSIAAASIVAKVARDAAMIALGSVEPDYGWAEHKGYGSPHHLRAAATLGPSVHHRLTWAPFAVGHQADARPLPPGLPGLAPRPDRGLTDRHDAPTISACVATRRWVPPGLASLLVDPVGAS
jgi:ribonuclease HII